MYYIKPHSVTQMYLRCCKISFWQGVVCERVGGLKFLELYKTVIVTYHIAHLDSQCTVNTGEFNLLSLLTFYYIETLSLGLSVMTSDEREFTVWKYLSLLPIFCYSWCYQSQYSLHYGCTYSDRNQPYDTSRVVKVKLSL